MHISPDRWAMDAIPGSMAVESIPLPRRATSGSAGYDFVTPVDVTVAPGEDKLIPTGIRCEMQPGWVLLLFPRSSIGFKYDVRLSNTVGVIDSDYFHADNEGHIMVKLRNPGPKPLVLSAGDRFCQGIFLPYGITTDDAADGERTGGMGSTGKK
ncbi:MAG: deoxyuridine 5'-triphosphate nucleotidohydrolase [Clostridia bacterium]|nr:deoxyuridine 5'-triphosphate nucleotidohydrolase [Clostridia bacterium]